MDDEFDFRTSDDATAEYKPEPVIISSYSTQGASDDDYDAGHKDWSPLLSVGRDESEDGGGTEQVDFVYEPIRWPADASAKDGHGHDDWCDLLSMGGQAVEDEAAFGDAAADDPWL